MPLCRKCRKDVDQAAKFCSHCGINDPVTGKTKPKRKVLKWILWIFVGIVVIGILSQGREKEPAKAALQKFEPSAEGVIAVESAEQNELPVLEAQVPNEPEPEWNAHEFEVVKDEDISAGNRLRRRVTVMAPTALTREDRIATLIEAAIQAWQKHHSQFIAMSLIPFESGPPIARMDYAPDKCGVSGTKCTGKVWTDVNASDVIFTPGHQQVYTAWTNSQDKFIEVDPDYGFEVINEDHLKAFLAEQFDTTPDDISKVFIEVSIGSLTSQEEMTIPRQLVLRGHLGERDKKVADEAACRANLQCWGDKHHLSATMACQPLVERQAKYDFEWTDTWSEAKFPRFSWGDREQGTVKYIGDKVKFQNGFGAWQHMSYWCTYNSDSGSAKVELL